MYICSHVIFNYFHNAYNPEFELSLNFRFVIEFVKFRILALNVGIQPNLVMKKVNSIWLQIAFNIF